jgi:hypothetical protein
MGGHFSSTNPGLYPGLGQNKVNPPTASKKAPPKARRRAPQPRWETPVPPGVTGSHGPAVIDWSQARLGREFGPWQSYVTRQMLRHDANDDLIARIMLVSTGRQNGKTVIVQGLWGWLLDQGRELPPFAGWTEMLAAAHDAKQARKMYNRVRADIEGSKELLGRIKTTQWAGITGGPIEFDTVTGQPGSARGSTAGAIAWDEMLTQHDWEMWEALGPTQSAQRSPIMLLTSTAGHSHSVVLRAFYDRLVRQATGAEKPDPKFYGAWWQSDHLEVGYDANGERRPLTAADWLQVAKANPGLGDGRLTRDAVILDHSILPRESWFRERLNHFVDVVADGALPPGAWAANRVPGPMEGLTGPYSLGVDIQPGWERATICVAGLREDGRVGVEVYRDLRRADGEPVTAARIIAEVAAFPDIDQVLAIAYDQVSGAAPAFLRHHTETGLPWDPLKPAAMVSACMDVTERILAATLAVNDPLLDAQMAQVAKRPVGQDGAFRFSRQASTGPIDAVMAMTLAVHSIAYLGGGPLIG